MIAIHNIDIHVDFQNYINQFNCKTRSWKNKLIKNNWVYIFFQLINGSRTKKDVADTYLMWKFQICATLNFKTLFMFNRGAKLLQLIHKQSLRPKLEVWTFDYTFEQHAIMTALVQHSCAVSIRRSKYIPYTLM